MTEDHPVRHRTVALSLLGLVLLVTAAYLPGIKGPFIFDDNWNIQPTRIDSLSLEQLVNVAGDNQSGMLGRSLPVLSFALNWHFGNDATTFAFKTTNVAIHVGNTLLVWCLVRLLCNFADSTTRMRRSWVSLATAALWALHPLQVSTVLYTVQRMTLMMTTFVLLSLITYTIARTNQSKEGRTVLPWLVLSGLLALCAVLSKENGALLPLYVIGLELLLLRRATTPPLRCRHLRKVCLYACTAIIFAVTAALIAKTPAFVDAYAARDFDLPGRLLSQLNAMVMYLQWIVVPTPSTMTFYHDAFPIPFGFGAREAFSAMVLSSIAALVVLLRHRRPLAAYGIGLFFVAHLMESTAIPLEPVFEHRNYLPSVGIAMWAAVSGSAALSRSGAHRRIGTIICAAVTIVLCVMTIDRAHLWSDSRTIGAHATVGQPNSERGWIELATASSWHGQLDQAWITFSRALERLPGNPHLALQRLRLAWSHGVDDPDFHAEAVRSLGSGAVTTPTALVLVDLVDRKVEDRDFLPSTAQLRALYDAIGPSRSWQVSGFLESRILFQHHRLLLENRELERAVETIESLAALLPESGEVAMRQAETMALSGDRAGSATALERALRYADVDDEQVAERIRRVVKSIESIRSTAEAVAP